MPPPCGAFCELPPAPLAVFAATVLSTSLSAARLMIPPPSGKVLVPPSITAALCSTATRSRVSVPSFSRPQPKVQRAWAIVSPEIVTVPDSTWKRATASPPEIVSAPAPGPAITRLPRTPGNGVPATIVLPIPAAN